MEDALFTRMTRALGNLTPLAPLGRVSGASGG